MDYSLLNKFRGAWLGSFIAVNIKEQTLNNSDHNLSVREKQSSYLTEEKLLSLGKRQWRSLSTHWDQDIETEPQAQQLWQAPLKAHDLALLGLPIILYYHDYWSYLSNFLQSQGKEHQLAQTNRDCLLIWAYIIRLGLRGELSQPNLTSKILKETDINTSAAYQWLSTIETLSQQGDNSQKLLKNSSDRDDFMLSLSLFYFLNNVHDFNLSTQQGLDLTNSQQITLAALSGALSGADNGLSIIPPGWHNSCQQKNYYQYLISKTADIMGGWLGSDFTRATNRSRKIVTSTGVLQPRHNLKIISQ